MAYVPWRKRRAERRNATVKDIVRNSVLHVGLVGPQDTRSAGFDAAAAISKCPGPSGKSLALILCGRRTKLHGELYEHGEPATHHADVDDPASASARRLKIRLSARQAVEPVHSNEAFRRSVAARARTLDVVTRGQSVCFLQAAHQR